MEVKGSQDEQYRARVEKFDRALSERLKGLTSDFLQIRESMGMGSNVGFGYLPEVHGVYSLGMLVDLKRGQSGELLYSIGGEISPKSYIPFTQEEQSKIAVMPDLKVEKPYIVSIYQRKGWKENQEIEEALLDAPASVYRGVIAHEIAHVFEWGVNAPEWLTDVRNTRQRDIDETLNYPDWNKRLNDFDFSGEGVIDIIASRLGFKREILDKINYMIRCAETYEGSGDLNSLLKTPGRVLLELRARIKEVERYS